MERFSMKRAVAVLAAAVMTAASVTGCSSSTDYSMTANGKKVNAGVYINFILNEMTNQMYTMYYSGEITEMKECLDKQVDGVDFRTYVKDKALEQTKEFVAVQTKFDELGLTLSEDDVSQIEDSISSTWGSQKEFYELEGVSRESLKMCFEHSYKKEAIFDHYYMEGGETPVTDDDVNKYISDNYIRYKLVTIPKSTNEDAEQAKTENEEYKNLWEQYIAEAEELDFAGFDKIISEYDEYSAAKQAEEQAALEAAQSEEGTEDGTSLDLGGLLDRDETASAADGEAAESTDGAESAAESSAESAAESAAEAENTEEQKAADSAAEEKTSESVVEGEVSKAEAGAEQSAAEETVTAEESKADESKAEESAVEERKAEESKADESAAEESKAEESKADESAAEESKAEESKADESAAEESKSDESADESKTDESAADESAEDASTDTDSTADGEEAEEEPDPYANETIVNFTESTDKNYDYYNEDYAALLTEIKGAEYGKVGKYENDNYYYIFMSADVSERTDYAEENHEDIIHKMKDDEFDGMLKGWIEACSIVVNDKAIKRYTVQEIYDRQEEYATKQGG